MNNFTRIEGNRICRKIGWRTGPEAEMMCEAFRNGETGFPWIDASIRKMRQDGWIHHLCRMSLATFLTIGHMWCSWEVGQQVRPTVGPSCLNQMVIFGVIVIIESRKVLDLIM